MCAAVFQTCSFQTVCPKFFDDYLTSEVSFSALGTSLGDCIEESFTVSSPGVAAPPVICGFNTGQHSNATYFYTSKILRLFHFPHVLVFLDASDNCNELVFNTRQGSTANWDIKGIDQLEFGHSLVFCHSVNTSKT